MDLKVFSELIQMLVWECESFSIPTLGIFTIEDIPSKFAEDGNTIYPPSYKLSFRMTNGEENNLFIEKYRSISSLSQEDAKSAVITFVDSLKKNLYKSKSVEIPEIGKFRITKEGNIFFVSDIDSSFFSERLGLFPISVKTIERGEKLEESLDEVKDNNEIDDENLDIEIVVDISDEIEEGEVEELPHDDLPHIETPDYDIVEAEVGENHIEEESIEEKHTEEKLDVTELEEDPVIMERRKRIIIILSVIIGILLLIIVFLLFKEQILSLMESWMYSEEELELIKGSL